MVCSGLRNKLDSQFSVDKGVPEFRDFLVLYNLEYNYCGAEYLKMAHTVRWTKSSLISRELVCSFV